MPFDFATPTRIVFGAGTLREVAPAAKEFGHRALIVTGRSAERSAPLAAQLGATGVSSCRFAVEGEPTLDVIRNGVQRAQEEQCNVVIGFGGGSALDAGKAIAALLTNRGELLDYLEVIGAGKPLTLPSAPFIAVPTTAGTGTEVTRNAVLASPEHRVKVSLRSPLMLARLAVVDPELTFDLPRDVTARTGLDAITQLIEPYVSLRANPLTDGFCVEGLRRVARSLRQAFHHGHDSVARTDMSMASLLSGLSLANAGLGVVHGLAGPVGGMFPAPHGAVCAALLPHGMDANIRALACRAPESGSLHRYQTVASILTGKPNASAREGVEWVAAACEELNIPGLGSYGVGKADFPVLLEKASQASSMKANPIALTREEMREVLARSL